MRASHFHDGSREPHVRDASLRDSSIPDRWKYLALFSAKSVSHQLKSRDRVLKSNDNADATSVLVAIRLAACV